MPDDPATVLGRMMERPLLISSILDYAAAVHARVPVISRDAQGRTHRYTYGDAARRTARLAHALNTLGVRSGDRVATLAWNGYRHFELYYAVSGIGAVCHTVNPRLFRDQLIHIFNHARDRFIFADPGLMPLVEDLMPDLRTVQAVVVMSDPAEVPESDLKSVLCYETLLARHADTIDWPEFDERTAAALCYTSGTTGNPKGVLYSHRSTVLHALGSIVGHDNRLDSTDVFMPVVPMFHVCAWGYPYACPIAGVAMVLPGPRLDGASLHELMEAERVTLAAGVPTLWYGLMEHLRRAGGSLAHLRGLVSGGAAASLALIEEIESHGVEFMHGWGLTETSPVATTNLSSTVPSGLSREATQRYKLRQGRPLYGVEFRVVGEDGAPVPQDGVTSGEILLRGNTVIAGYFHDEAASEGAFDPDGWFRTGDIGTIDEYGCLQLTDRAKDLIKSGGEWISSIDLENAALGHAGVAAAAAIAIPHPKWGERPLLVVVLQDGETPSKEEILVFLKDHVAHWWLPDDIAFVDAMPLTATGKISKRQLREQFRDYKPPAD
jgi:fatty-acyl-CoA synthase